VLDYFLGTVDEEQDVRYNTALDNLLDSLFDLGLMIRSKSIEPVLSIPVWTAGTKTRTLGRRLQLTHRLEGENGLRRTIINQIV
jgi:hypothetical protein